MDQALPQTILLKDYRPFSHRIETVELRFELDPEATRVSSLLTLQRDPAGDAPLVLDGQELILESVTLDGKALTPAQYSVDAGHLTIPATPEKFTLEIVTRTSPVKNTSLMGLYASNGNYFTQCEAEGFRKITYFPDRPDVMSRFTVTVVGDKAATPVMLSNGNCVERRDLEAGRHLAKWVDPFKKPAYLFALVAGKLECIEQTIKSASGKKKLLQVYVEPRDLSKTQHAMDSLVKSIRWDEKRFGLELDLDQYMIVATSDFNMGAMENKGLNVFNTKFVLADEHTATDGDYDGIESVIAHEYFHNWTGNRVTCRDWFQLSLKEGLTVFRDQEFSMDMTGTEGGRAVRRIGDVRLLRSVQFAEDAGPMAHPVRPDSYMEISNFYTVTIYEKGAEVVRMYQTMFGRKGFRAGMDLYFKRHDGQAVTTDDFFAAMVDANPGVLSDTERAQFPRWYSQAGTPRLAVTGEFDAKAQTYTLRIRQSCPPTPGQEEKKPFVIPFTLGLIDAKGLEIPLQLTGEKFAKGTSATLLASGVDNVFVFQNIKARPVPSLLRGFSAPVILDYDYSNADLAFLLTHDRDDFNRWEAGQRLFLRILIDLTHQAAAGETLTLPPAAVSAFRQVLTDPKLDAAFKTEALMLPTEGYLFEQIGNNVDPQAIHAARVFMRRTLAQKLKADLHKVYQANVVKGPYSPGPVPAGKRGLQGLVLALLLELGEKADVQLTAGSFEAATNMTDRMNAIGALMLIDGPERTHALAAFYDQFKDQALVVDKWLALQAGARGAGTLAQVKALMAHEAFSIKNPNKVRSLIGAFCANPACFHAADGSGYAFWAERVVELDAINPQVAARLARAASSWKKLEPKRQAMLKTALEGIAAKSGLSKDTYEVVTKSLAV
ncbi:MAG: pepN [Betaproteobacteria bacterium]|nr:pepN [Betaproteobacteria bacterium]